jgi:hypothetical protein
LIAENHLLNQFAKITPTKMLEEIGKHYNNPYDKSRIGFKRHKCLKKLNAFSILAYSFALLSKRPSKQKIE